MHDRVKVAVVILLALPVSAAAQAPEAPGANLDQLVSGLSPTMQFIINGVVLAVAVAAGLLSYFRKGKVAAPHTTGADMSAQVVGGALADRQSMQALAESNHKLAAEVSKLSAVIEKWRAEAAARDAEEGLAEKINDLVEERLRALEAPAPTRRPSR